MPCNVCNTAYTTLLPNVGIAIAKWPFIGLAQLSDTAFPCHLGSTGLSYRMC